MTKKEYAKTTNNLRCKLQDAKNACAAFSCLKQAMIEVPGVQNAIRSYWPMMLAIWDAKNDSPRTLDEALAKIESILATNVFSLKEEIEAWERGDWDAEPSGGSFE